MVAGLVGGVGGVDRVSLGVEGASVLPAGGAGCVAKLSYLWL